MGDNSTFPFNMDSGLLKEVVKLSDKEERSVSKQIVYLVKKGIENEGEIK